MSGKRTNRILVLQKDGNDATSVGKVLESLGYSVSGLTTSGSDAIEIAQRECPDLILSDLELQGKMNGIETAREIGSRLRIPVIFFTALSDEPAIQKAKTARPIAYLVKPVGPRQLKAGIETALFNSHAEKRSVRELERSNEELERFAHIASHDLQEPLRNISMFAQILSEELKTAISKEQMQLLDSIVRGTAKMRCLIQDLLMYSQVGTKAKPETIDLNFALAAAKENLEITIKEQKAQIVSQKLPLVEGYPQLIGQLLQNLISNALKFQDGKAPVIEISAIESSDKIHVLVKDNGIGFEPTHAAQIFDMFKRLHKGDAYPGTGMGLAICKKIVNLHGGEIWAESQPHGGSTFHFTLQKAS